MAGDDSTDDSQKTEEPTPKKLRDARERGQVALSREVNNWFMIFAAAIIVVSLGPGVLEDLQVLLVTFIAQPHELLTDRNGLGSVLRVAFLELASIMAPPLGVMLLAGFLGPFIQVGPLFSAETLKPSLEKISILKGFKRLFSSRSLIEFLKGILKLGLVTYVVIQLMLPFMGGVEHFIGLDVKFALFELHHLAFRLFLGVLGVLTVIAIIDYTYQRHEHNKKLKMSLQEIKDEHKQLEGDPHIKARLRELRAEKSRQRMMQSVPQADVVITNPTHYALAMKYDSETMNAPVLIAKGTDNIALKIREIAKDNDIPIVENPPFARALYDTMELNEMIPEEHYKAMAEIISYIFKLKNKTVH